MESGDEYIPALFPLHQRTASLLVLKGVEAPPVMDFVLQNVFSANQKHNVINPPQRRLIDLTLCSPLLTVFSLAERREMPNCESSSASTRHHLIPLEPALDQHFCIQCFSIHAF